MSVPVAPVEACPFNATVTSAPPASSVRGGFGSWEVEVGWYCHVDASIAGAPRIELPGLPNGDRLSGMAYSAQTMRLPHQFVAVVAPFVSSIMAIHALS